MGRGKARSKGASLPQGFGGQQWFGALNGRITMLGWNMQATGAPGPTQQGQGMAYNMPMQMGMPMQMMPMGMGYGMPTTGFTAGYTMPTGTK